MQKWDVLHILGQRSRLPPRFHNAVASSGEAIEFLENFGDGYAVFKAVRHGAHGNSVEVVFQKNKGVVIRERLSGFGHGFAVLVREKLLRMRYYFQEFFDREIRRVLAHLSGQLLLSG